jgi:sugar phosphate isomerase/epimerase
VEVLVESFAAFCDAAAARKLRVELEFVPIWGLGTLQLAWDIAREANRPESALLVDTWHLQKGSPDFESDLQLLATIPAQRLANIQLADATLAMQSESLHRESGLRRFPGDGDLENDRIVSVIAAKVGCDGSAPKSSALLSTTFPWKKPAGAARRRPVRSSIRQAVRAGARTSRPIPAANAARA